MREIQMVDLRAQYENLKDEIDRAIQAGVSSVPTFIRYDDDGTETERHVGAMGYKDLVGMLTR